MRIRASAATAAAGRVAPPKDLSWPNARDIQAQYFERR